MQRLDKEDQIFRQGALTSCSKGSAIHRAALKYQHIPQHFTMYNIWRNHQQLDVYASVRTHLQHSTKAAAPHTGKPQHGPDIYHGRVDCAAAYHAFLHPHSSLIYHFRVFPLALASPFCPSLILICCCC